MNKILRDCHGSILLVSIPAILVAGCDRPDTATFSVAGHDFVVPRKYLVDDRLKWLSATDVPGFIFVLNPEDKLEARIFVLVETSSSYCSSPTESAQKNELCKQNLTSYPGSILQNLRREPTGYRTFWNYYAEFDGSQGKKVVARCHAVTTSMTYGSCSAIGFHRGAYYEMEFGELRINELQGLHDQVRTLLVRWSS